MRVGRLTGILLIAALLGGCQTLTSQQPKPVAEGPPPAAEKPLAEARLRPEGPGPARPVDFGQAELMAQQASGLEANPPQPPDDLEDEIPDQKAAVTQVDLTAEGPDALVGRDLDWIEGQLGSPTLEEIRAPARVWSYNAADCVISLFFYPKVEGGSFTVLTYEVVPKNTDPENDQKCLSRLLVERQNVAQSG